MTMFDNLQAIARMVKGNLPKMKNNEDATINVSISPFIRALGYNTQDLDEVYPQYPILSTDAVDYAILRNDVPVMFIEAKSAGNKLQKKEWKQLFQYFNAAEVRFGILTNGLEYHFYTDFMKRHIMDEDPFLTIDMRNLDDRLVKELEAFSKTKFNHERILDGAQRRRIESLLARELEHPSDDFVRFLATQVHSGRLTEQDAQRYRLLVHEAWRGMVKRIENNSSISKPVNPTPKPPASGDIPVFGDYEGRRFEAMMLRTSLVNGFNGASNCIQYNGKLSNGKEAMIAAIRTINPTFNPGKKLHGLRFWHFTDPADGTEHALYIMSKHVMPDEALRKRVLDLS